jgi:hypothetical protein
MTPIEIEEIAVAVMSNVREAIPSSGTNVEGLAAFMAHVDSLMGREVA